MADHVEAAVVLLRDGAGRVGPDQVGLLEAIGATASISAAARRRGLSFRGAWNAVQALNRLFGVELVTASAGGSGGGGARLTPAGELFLSEYGRLSRELGEAAERLRTRLAEAGSGHIVDACWAADIVRVDEGELQLVTARGLPVVANVPASTRRTAPLRRGGRALIRIPSQAVLLAACDVRATSARNIWRGEVVGRAEEDRGSRVDLKLASGDDLQALVTHASADALGLEPGATAWAVLKASQITVDPLHP